jgi:hypothetical protein
VLTVDSLGTVGTYTSLMLDGEGIAHISYYDVLNGDLKYALASGPATVVLWASVSGGNLQLTWSPMPQATAFWVYGASNLPWFAPGMAPGYEYRLTMLPSGTTTWSGPNGVGDPNTNWTYLVMAVDAMENELARSNRVGEVDFEADLP